MSSITTTTTTTNITTSSTMLSLQQHIEAESARWVALRGDASYSRSTISSSTTTSVADTIFSSLKQSRYNTHTLSRRSSTSSFATEFEPEPAAAQQPFVAPRDFNGAPITVYASLEAAVAARLGGSGSGGGGGEAQEQGGRGEEPRRLVTPGKLYENEEDDDEIVYA
jgi:hypothetical protein